MKLLVAFATGYILGVVAGHDVGVREESDRIERLLALASGGGPANPPKRRTATRRNAPPETP